MTPMMKYVCPLFAAALLLAAAPAFCDTLRAGTDVPGENGLCRRYLAEGKKYRSQSRFELARQSYAQALSICSNGRDIADAKKGLNTVELLLRTMR